MEALKYTRLITRWIMRLSVIAVIVLLLASQFSGLALFVAGVLTLLLLPLAFEYFGEDASALSELRTRLPKSMPITDEMKHATYMWLRRVGMPEKDVRRLRRRYEIPRALFGMALLLIFLVFVAASH